MIGQEERSWTTDDRGMMLGPASAVVGLQSCARIRCVAAASHRLHIGMLGYVDIGRGVGDVVPQQVEGNGGDDLPQLGLDFQSADGIWPRSRCWECRHAVLPT